MRALVTGASGFIGRQLVHELIERGWQVKALVRDEAKAERLDTRVALVFGDVRDEETLARAVQGVDVIFHLAATIAGDWDTHRATTIEATQRLLHKADAANVAKCVLASSLAVYDKAGALDTSVLNESWPLLKDSQSAGSYARAKIEAERVVLTTPLQRTKTAVVRLGLVYGADRLFFPHLGELVGENRWAFGRPSLRLPLIDMHSAVRALIAVAESERTDGRVYNAVDADQPSRETYVKVVEELARLRFKTRYVPVGPVRLACRFVELARRLPGLHKLPDVSAEKIRQRSVEPMYDSSRLRADTLWVGTDSVRTGVLRALDVSRNRKPARVQRVGLIGAGRIARLHLEALRTIRDVQIVGVLDTNAEAAAQLGREASAPSFTSAAEFYNTARPDIVHVLTPPLTHASVALEAISKSVHVLLEKPAVASLDDCDMLLAAADRHGVTVGVDENVAWDPLIRRARALAMSGALGELVHVDIFMGFDLKRAKLVDNTADVPWTLRLEGGVLEDLLPHPLSVLRSILGTQPQLVTHHVARSGRVSLRIHDELRLTCGTSLGTTANVTMSLTVRPDEFLIRVFGTRASVRIDVQNMLFDCLSPIPGPKAVGRGVRTIRSGVRNLVQTVANAARLAMKRASPPGSPVHLLRAHYQALHDGSPLPCSLHDARFPIEVARAIWPHTAATPELKVAAGSERSQA